jgi:ferredoxin
MQHLKPRQLMLEISQYGHEVWTLRPLQRRCAWVAPRRPRAAVARTHANASASSSGGGGGLEPSEVQLGGVAASASSVEVSYRGRTVAVAAGTKLRTALLQGGLSPHNGRAQLINCRGLGTCGTCAVEIRYRHGLGHGWSVQQRCRQYQWALHGVVHVFASLPRPASRASVA